MEQQQPPPMVFSMPQQRQVENDGADDGCNDEMLEVLIHQVEKDEDQSQSHDVGFVMWPSAVILSRWITTNPSIVFSKAAGGKDVLELGAGCGLVGLTAATLLRNQKQQQQQQEQDADNNSSTVIFTDYNSTVLDNLERNIRLNDLQNTTSVVGLDFFDQSPEENKEEEIEVSSSSYWVDMKGNRQSQVGLILAADILCYSNDATLVAKTIQSALVEGGQAIVLGPDSEQRFGVEEFPEECERLGLEVQVTNHNAIDSSDGDKQTILHHDLDAAGYGDAGRGRGRHDFTMFTIDKPIATRPIEVM